MLPLKRYEIFKIEHRKVNNYGHISFKNNFYSVPYKYIGKTLIIKSTDTLIKIFEDTQELAVHQLCNEDGQFITYDAHKPPEKQRKQDEQYIVKAMDFGVNTHAFLQQIKIEKPFQWHRIMSGIFHLQHTYSKEIVEKACNRALQYNTISFLSVKNICKNNLYDKSTESLSVNISKGYAHNLKKYDLFTNLNN